MILWSKIRLHLPANYSKRDDRRSSWWATWVRLKCCADHGWPQQERQEVRSLGHHTVRN